MPANVTISQDQQTGNIRSALGGSAVFSVVDTVTLAQLNAGKTIVQALEGRQLRVVGYYIKCNGAVEAATAVVLSDTAASPVDIVSLAIANCTDGAEFSADSTITGQTKGAGHLAALTVSKGIQVRKTGSAATTATSLTVRVDYQLV